MTNTGTSGIQHQDKKFHGKIAQYFDFFLTYRRYFKHFFLLVDRTSIGFGCVIIFYRFSFMYAKYFAVYFCRTINLMRELPTLYYVVCVCSNVGVIT